MDQIDSITDALETTTTGKFWRIPSLGGLELSHAAYTRHAFPRHAHEEYILGVMVQGVEKINRQGTSFYAPTGSLLLINPGEPHANYSADGGHFAYRTLYPSSALLQRTVRDLTDREQALPWFPEPVVQHPETAQLLLQLYQTLEQSALALEQESCFLTTMAALIERQARLRFPVLSESQEPRHVQHMRDYLEANFTVFRSRIGRPTVRHRTRTEDSMLRIPPHEDAMDRSVCRVFGIARFVSAERRRRNRCHASLSERSQRIRKAAPAAGACSRGRAEWEDHLSAERRLR